MTAPRAIVTDIEGTTSSISFVKDVLFPFARARMAAFLAAHETAPDVAAALGDVPGLNRTHKCATLLEWMDADSKATPLKTLQGLIWRSGFESGELRGHLYADAAPCLHAWHAAGIKLYIYSSGSVAAQKLLFGYSDAGDLTPLFSGFFDTHVGTKREEASYAAIHAQLDLPAADIAFLSDIAEELDAAQAAGLRTCQLVRPEDNTAPSGRHPEAATFPDVSRLLGLG